MTEEEYKTQEQAAEHVRLAYRHMIWSAAHLKAYYDLIKPEGAPDANYNDPNQLQLNI